MTGSEIVRVVADDGRIVELVDAVDNAGGQFLAPLREMLVEFFPDEPYAVDLVM